jgi:hypothetical protein
MSLIQILLLIAIAYIILKTAQKYRISAITVREFFLWICFWLIGALVVLFPKATDSAAQFLGIARGADLIVYIGIIILFAGLFFLLVRLERLERDVTKIVRKMALEEESK